MSTARVTCPRCGEVRVDIHAVDLQVCSTNPDRSFFAFDCPGCTSEVRQRAFPPVVIALVSAGVQHHIWDIPAEALETHDGPPLTNDDLLDFVRELGSFVALDGVEGAS